MSTKKPSPAEVDTWLPTRRTLLSRLKNWNDQESWREFFNTYWRLIFSVARQAGLSESEAQEVVQETVITVAKQMPDFRYDRTKGSFKNWLKKTARWRILDRLRKRQREQRIHSKDGNDPDVEEVMDPQDPNPFDAIWDREWRQNLFEVVLERVKKKVAPKEFQVFDFCTIREWTPKEVASHLNLFRAQVYYIQRKVDRLVRQEMVALRLEMGDD